MNRYDSDRLSTMMTLPIGMKSLALWWQVNNLALNVIKTKELGSTHTGGEGSSSNGTMAL